MRNGTISLATMIFMLGMAFSSFLYGVRFTSDYFVRELFAMLQNGENLFLDFAIIEIVAAFIMFLVFLLVTKVVTKTK